MRKLLLALVLLALPVFASAGDALLTADGKLFQIDVELGMATPDITTAADTYLVLTSRRGAEVTHERIPASQTAGSHVDPAMAYDAETGMLFVFWLHRESLTGSELLFASRDADGVWSDATQFGGRIWDFRENLRIAVTRKWDDEDGVSRAGISVHAVWWEFDTHDGEWFAQYQMLTIENGTVFGVPAPLDLRKIARDSGAPKATEKADLDILKHPLLFTSTKQDSVLVVYGDSRSQQLHEVRVRPGKVKNDGRLRVPVGRREGGATVPRFAVGSNRMEGLYGDNDRMAFFTREKDSLRYVVMKDGQWSDAQQIALDTQITASAAVDALRRLVNEH